MRKPLVLVAAALGALAIVGIGLASLNRNTSVHLGGDLEVPIRDTAAQGQATFRVAKDGGSIDYKLIVANVENVFMAHIHVAQPGLNGPIGVWLHPGTTPGVQGPLGAGRQQGPIAEGTITSADLVGPLAGRSIDDLVALLDEGGAYVNVHTNDGVDPPNTGPGDFPGGEIRGDLG